MTLHPDRLFPSDPAMRELARSLYASVADAPIVSPHGHTEPRWWALDESFADPATLFVTPDHYVTRMLVSQGVPFEALGIGAAKEEDPREIWRTFAAHFHLFRGTPSRLWIEHSLETVFGITERLSAATADAIYDRVAEALPRDELRPRAIAERFRIEVVATTDGALDDLSYHRQVRESGWPVRIVPTYRPDAVVDPQATGFAENVEELGRVAGISTASWQGYLDAHRARRAFFRDHGATATDHGHATPQTADLPPDEAAALYEKVRTGKLDNGAAELFRAQMLTEMARMSAEDGMVMQLHSGSHRNHSAHVLQTYGRDNGFDIPLPVSFTDALRPLLNAVGHDPDLRLILFALDEATYTRELAPLAGAWPSILLGPPWWFHDSFEGIMRYRRQVTETAGFYNSAGFNDDTRALTSIPARHDLARRADASFLAELVTTHRLDEDEAHDLAWLMAGDLARKAYRF
ncbi:glucuronate isomerase [Aliihoeflea aestuarii]|jgi:glucuronate isomerase|uniref:glucuronate isomerase n=1 Tax=Aliihoeflea aestuarii TaxID=453840 RepID=UPI002095206F|nr:glucuronate isomerase [Aliihoeflea aestuarii]MCO6392590.1 glucuronate isomerase [Aliihoeflea aestuarii]